MAPVRRYLRITKYSVLECRIYLDNPALAQSWLLNPRNPILPQVIEAIRPLVIPKLREEKERSKKKSSKKKAVKDVIVKDDFEVSMFLTETSTRHSLLYKQKHFREKGPNMLQSNTSKLIAETNAIPVDVEEEDFAPIRIEEDSGDEDVRLGDIPRAALAHQQPKRPRRNINANYEGVDDSDDDNAESDAFDNDDTSSAIEVGSDTELPPAKRLRSAMQAASEIAGQSADNDRKKKLAMDVSYEGFAIYGRVLCLVVKRRETKPTQPQSKDSSNNLGGQARMENWITSTQIPVGEEAI